MAYRESNATHHHGMSSYSYLIKIRQQTCMKKTELNVTGYTSTLIDEPLKY